MRKIPRKYLFAALAAAGQVGAALLWGVTGAVTVAGLLLVLLCTMILSLRWDVRRGTNESRELRRQFDQAPTREQLDTVAQSVQEQRHRLEELLRSAGMLRQDAELRHAKEHENHQRTRQSIKALTGKVDAMARGDAKALERTSADLRELKVAARGLKDQHTRTLESTRDILRQLRAEERAERRRWRERSDVLLRQVEAMIGLYDLIEVRADMPPSRGWALSPDALGTVVGHILQNKPGLVLECGSGTSTIWMGYAAELAGSTRIIALEHDAGYAERTRAEVRRHGLEDRIDVRLAPLTDVEIGGETWLWYDPASWTDVNGLDFVLIDGPPEASQKMARYPAVPLLYDRLAPTAVLLLDDTRREDEQLAVERWLDHHADLAADTIDNEKGAIVLTRKGTREGSALAG